MPDQCGEIIVVLEIFSYLLIKVFLLPAKTGFDLFLLVFVTEFLDHRHALDVADLNFLYRVFALYLHLILHFAEVALELLLVPLISDLDLMQTLAQLVSVPLELKVLRVGLVQLLSQTKSEPFQNGLDLPKTPLDCLQ